MRNISLEQSGKGVYKFNKVIPLSRSQFQLKHNAYSGNHPLEPIEEIRQLSLSKKVGQDTVELTFSSISDVSMEFVKFFDDVAGKNVKALLLSVSNIIGKKKFYLIELKDLTAGFSKINDEEEELPKDKCEFEDRFHSLSLREQQVLHKVSKGNTSNEIARDLFISTNTVKNHRKNIKKKLNFNNNQDYSRFLKWTLEYCGKGI